jgi:uncharacterized protein YdcH (DUF465 family)
MILEMRRVGVLISAEGAATPSRLMSVRALAVLHSMRQEVPMSQIPGSIKDRLLVQNEEYRRLDEQHHEYESRLVALTEKAVLSDEEQVEETTLKKKKLQLKDRMEAIARQAREGLHP